VRVHDGDAIGDRLVRRPTRSRLISTSLLSRARGTTFT